MSTLVFNTNSNTKLAAYLNRKFLTTAISTLVLAPFATRATLSTQQGTLTMRYFKKVQGAKSRVQKITNEGDAVTANNATINYVDIALEQFADSSKISNRLQKTEIFDNIEKETDDQSEAAALFFDAQCRNALVNPTTGASVRLYAQGAASFAALNTAGYTSGKATLKDVKRIVTKLKNAKTPKLSLKSSDGKLSWKGYIVVVSTDIASDLQDDADWKDMCKQSRPELLQTGEIGQMFGAKIIETTEPFIEDGGGTEDVEATPASGHNIIHTMIGFGQEAFTAPDLATGGDWNKPQMTVLDKADKSDIINQWIYIAWTAYFAAKVTDRTWVVICKAVIGQA